MYDDLYQNRLSVKTLREMFRKELEDEGLRIAYIANIAMLLHDRYGITDYKTRNQAASDILKLILY